MNGNTNSTNEEQNEQETIEEHEVISVDVDASENTATISVREPVTERDSYKDSDGDRRELEIEHAHTHTVTVSRDGGIDLPEAAPEEIERVVRGVDIDWEQDEQEGLEIELTRAEVEAAIESDENVTFSAGEYTIYAEQLADYNDLSVVEKMERVKADYELRDGIVMCDGTVINVTYDDTGATAESGAERGLVTDGGEVEEQEDEQEEKRTIVVDEDELVKALWQNWNKYENRDVQWRISVEKGFEGTEEAWMGTLDTSLIAEDRRRLGPKRFFDSIGNRMVTYDEGREWDEFANHNPDAIPDDKPADVAYHDRDEIDEWKEWKEEAKQYVRDEWRAHLSDTVTIYKRGEYGERVEEEVEVRYE